MATFIPEAPSALRAKAIESARRRAEQRPIAAELKQVIRDAGVTYAAIELRLGLQPQRLTRLFECSTVWPSEPLYFRARVLAAIAALS